MLGIFIDNRKRTKRVFKWWHPTAGFGLMAIIVSVVRMRSCGESENGMRYTTGHVSNPMK